MSSISGNARFRRGGTRKFCRRVVVMNRSTPLSSSSQPPRMIPSTRSTPTRPAPGRRSGRPACCRAALRRVPTAPYPAATCPLSSESQAPLSSIPRRTRCTSSTTTMRGGNLVYRLHALNILTGQDISPPIVIQASAPGTGAGSSGGTVSFNAGLNRQRAGLVLANRKVYVAFSSFCDVGNYHGWILSYTYNGSSFQQVNAYDVTPNGIQGGIWGGDAGLDADSSGNLYYVSGNGTFDANTGGSDYGDSFVRLNAALQVQDYFTPFNQSCLSAGDQDLGSGGPLLIPGANALTAAGKEGRPYVVSTTNMGKYTADPNLTCNGSAEENRTNVDKAQQELPPGTVGGDFSTPAFWNGPSGQSVYYTSVNGPTWAFSWNGTKLSTTPTSTSTDGNGGTAVVSSNGTAAATGIVWKIDYGSELHAYDASNLA